MMKLEDLSVNNIKNGYTEEDDTYRCLTCGKTFETGEIYPENGRLFEAARAAKAHIGAAHPDYTAGLIDNESKYNPLTANQKRLLKLFAAGTADSDIAKEMGISASTVRHQRFIFREKAKQAKLYIALYENVFESKSGVAPVMMPVHEYAKMVDERFMVTENEQQKILERAFASQEPLRLNIFPVKEKKKVVVLTKIASSFTKGKEYNEKEVNAVLSAIYGDYVTIRRYLIEYGFLNRTKDGSKYWLM